MISFFTRSGGAGIIRGEQVADYLGAKLNPKSDYEDDLCIYVKCIPPKDHPKKTYIDVVEDSAGLRWVKSHPEVGIIASSKTIYDSLSKLPNKIVFIPQHHCNFERFVRDRKTVEVAGIIGNKAAFQYPLDDLAKKLGRLSIDLKLLIKKKFDDREEVVDFYKTIDLQLVWRPKTDGILRNPLKLINAMSFGIPTVAYPEEDFVAELNDYFMPAKTIDELMSCVATLKYQERIYNVFVYTGVFQADKYHIENISKLYIDLSHEL